MHRDRRGAGIPGPDRLDRRRLQLSRPVQHVGGPGPLPGLHGPHLCRPAQRLAAVHRAQAVRAGVLFHGRLRLGHQRALRPDPGTQGPVPGRPGPPCAEREHRADRRPLGAVRKAGRLPLQRQQIWRRRPGRRVDQPAPAVLGVQRIDRGGKARPGRLQPRLYAGSVTQRHRPDREPAEQRRRRRRRLRPRPGGRPRRSGRTPERQRRDHGLQHPAPRL